MEYSPVLGSDLRQILFPDAFGRDLNDGNPIIIFSHFQILSSQFASIGFENVNAKKVREDGKSFNDEDIVGKLQALLDELSIVFSDTTKSFIMKDLEMLACALSICRECD